MNLYNATVFFKINNYGNGKHIDYKVLAEDVNEVIEKIKIFLKERENFDQITEIKLLHSDIIM